MSGHCKISPFSQGTLYEWDSSIKTSFKPLDEFVASCPEPGTTVEIIHTDGDIFDLKFFSSESIKEGKNYLTKCVFKYWDNTLVEYKNGKCDLINGLVVKSLKAFTKTRTS